MCPSHARNRVATLIGGEKVVERGRRTAEGPEKGKFRLSFLGGAPSGAELDATDSSTPSFVESQKIADSQPESRSRWLRILFGGKSNQKWIPGPVAPLAP